MKNEPNWNFVPNQKKGPKIDPNVSNLRSREFLFQGVQVHPKKQRGKGRACLQDGEDLHIAFSLQVNFCKRAL